MYLTSLFNGSFHEFKSSVSTSSNNNTDDGDVIEAEELDLTLESDEEDLEATMSDVSTSRGGERTTSRRKDSNASSSNNNSDESFRLTRKKSMQCK